jgi:inhibitor of KinA sporulation pathway (predicted exonuclease)
MKILIVDLECTAWKGEKPPIEKLEIIEFGVVESDLNGVVTKSHSQLVRPVEHPRLSDFCIGLTKIDQQMVDTAPTYAEAVKLLNSLLATEDYFAWASWGKSDKELIESLLTKTGCAPHFYSLQHINLKAAFQKLKGSKRKSALLSALSYFDLRFDGEHHRAEHDALNTARLLSFINNAIK